MKLPRPPLLTFLCILGFLGSFLKVYFVLSPTIRQVSPWYPTYVSMSTIFMLICLYGLWLMRRWSVWALGAYVIIHASVHWALGIRELNAMALALSLTVISAFYYQRMD